MSFDINFVKAETHTPEYLMHKYWARKPHNVISEYVAALTCEGDTILDPFCGSGVTLREGALLGRNCIGIDVNPTAALISRVLLNPPVRYEFVEEFEKILDRAQSRFGNLYRTSDGREIRYVSHRIIARCGCGETLKQEQCKKDGRKLLCPRCGSAVNFNLEFLADTEVYDVAVEGDKDYMPSPEEIARQKVLSSFSDPSVDTSAYDCLFPTNKRILAFEGMRTSSLFTPRNYCVISYVCSEIWKTENERIRDCMLLLLTSSVAQCSRLIASRNNLTTGGPAWSVPGFWVPREHLESNPFVHLRARLQKFVRALDCIVEKPVVARSDVILGDSLSVLAEPDFSDFKANLIFLDPPYGDSVPYTEFSNLWNSFLKCIPSSDDDISVSNRVGKTQAWDSYNGKLNSYMDCFSRHLADDGKLLITFNNNDMRAWTSLISALQKNGFVCKSVSYQIPAVIPSRAQMAIKSSYISDIYSVYTLEPGTEPSHNLSPLLSHLCFVANSRGGSVPKTVLDREFMIFWLRNNIDYSLLDDKDDIVASVFDYEKKNDLFNLRAEYLSETKLLEASVRRSLDKILMSGSCLVLDAYLRVCEDCREFGTMELWEFSDFLSGYAVINGKIYGSVQMTLDELCG